MEMSNIEKAVEIRRAYQKKWRTEHKDRVSEYNCRYWEKKAEQQTNNSKKTVTENGKTEQTDRKT